MLAKWCDARLCFSDGISACKDNGLLQKCVLGQRCEILAGQVLISVRKLWIRHYKEKWASFIRFSIAIIISSFFPDRFILCSLLILKIPLERIKSCNNLNIWRYLPVERIEKVLDKTHLALSWVSHKVGWGTLFPPCIILLILSSHHRHRHHYCHNHGHIVIVIIIKGLMSECSVPTFQHSTLPVDCLAR